MAVQVFKVLKFFTTIGFLICIAFVYSKIRIIESSKGSIDFIVDGENFFYICIASFMVITSLFAILQNLILSPKRKGVRYLNNETRKRNFQAWFLGLRSIVDIFFITVVVFLGYYFQRDQADNMNIGYITYAGPTLLILWIVIFPFFINRKSKSN